jgi:NADH:ubiquinone oxidoreductase subunit E
MTKKTKLILCLGSSCYSRGNQHVLEVIKEYLKENNLKDRVDFRGQLCSGNCSNGPIMRLDEERFEQIDEQKAIKILENYFFPVTT